MDIGKILLVVGGVLVLIGVIYILFPHISSPPKLSGDILIKRGNFTFYFPIVTSILISIILAIIFNIFFRK